MPVEHSYHGSALLYRLLESYPAEKLLIVEAGFEVSKPDRRIGGVTYVDRRLPLKRLASTRLARWYGTAALLSATSRALLLRAVVARHRPEAILTVAHGYSWLTAAALGSSLKVPLHLIVHDEIIRTAPYVRPINPWLDRQVGYCYRQATTRLCVSPYLAEEYLRRYGAEGQVLYPSRAPDAPCFSEPPERIAEPTGTPTFAYAGTINSASYVEALKQLARCLAPLGGRVLIFGPITEAQAKRCGLDADNIALGGLLSPGQLVHELRDRADALFVPMSFAANDRQNMEVSFPSKLADYTAVGLPLLIYGPTYCSAVRWARDNEGVAEVVSDKNKATLSAVLLHLQNSEYRLMLAKAALKAGERYFSHRAAWDVFRSALGEEGVAREPSVLRDVATT